MDRLERAGDLKAELTEFSRTPRLDRYFRQLVNEHFPDGTVVGDEGDVVALIEEFLFKFELPDGTTVVDRFVASRPDLPAADREMLLGWKDIVDGIFELRERDGDALIAFNLVDEMTYRIRSNMGVEVIEQLPVGGFLSGNLAAVGDDWMMSGQHRTYQADAGDQLREAALQIAMRFPEKAFRNPEKLARGWEMQAEQREAFIELYGDDTIVVPGHEVTDKVREFYRHHYKRTGNDPADWPDPGIDLSQLQDLGSVGIIYDLEDGLGFYPEFGSAKRVFETPELIVQRHYRELISDYLRNEDTSPIPLRRLAARDPEKAGRVFRKLLKKKSFSWAEHGEVLLRKYKPDYFENPPLPRTVPVDLDGTAQSRAGR